MIKTALSRHRSARYLATLGFSLIAGTTSVSVAALDCEYNINNSWDGAFAASITISNDTPVVVNDWQVTWQQNGDTNVSTLWNANYEGTNPYTATPVDWNATIQPGSSVMFGFLGAGSNTTATILDCSAGGESSLSSSSSLLSSSSSSSLSSASSSSSFTLASSSSSSSSSLSSASSSTTAQNSLTIELESLSNQSGFAPLSVGYDTAASDGAYVVWSNNGTSQHLSEASDAASGQVTVGFTLSQTSDVRFDISANFATAEDDSFYYKLDNGSWGLQNNDVTTGWQTLTIATFTSLSEGDHQLHLLRREDGSQMDAVTLTASMGDITQATGSSSSTFSSSSSSSASSDFSENLVLAVNVGGDEVTSGEVTYEADNYFVGGNLSNTSDPIAGTSDDALYQTERWGTYSYEIPVSAAEYDIALYFNEMYHTENNARIFSVSVEDQPVVENFDLHATAGHDMAYSERISGIRVNDGSLTIQVTAQVDNGTLSGFAVYSDQGELQLPQYPLVEARNPMIYADVPDPSILRVGSNYYLSSTTMHMNPGVPVMKSTDLKNWTVVNYGHQALGNNAALNMTNGQNAYSKGSWASSLRYKNGTYYLTTFSYTTGQTYIYKTSNIEGGNWSTHSLGSLYHDSSLLLDDDGRNYLAYGSDEVRIIELNSDATAVKPGGVNQVLIRSASAVAGNSFVLKAEGTQIQKINGWYYIHNICWPSGASRTQVIHRSRNLLGPYEGRVVLQDDGVAQGHFVDTPDGDWYAILFGDRGAVGRIPYLIPVRWQDGWPIVGVNGQVPDDLGFTVEDRGMQGVVDSDEFSSGALKNVWQWNHNPDNTGWSLSQRPGYLRITNTRVDSNIHNTRNTLTQRMFGPTSIGTVRLDVSGLRDGDTAGLAAFADQYGFVGVQRSGSQHYLVMVNNNGKNHRQIERVPLSQNIVFLRVRGDFTFINGNVNNRVDDAVFQYSLDGNSWRDIGNTLQMNYELSHFMGYRFALFNFATRSTGGYADFDYFHVTD